MECTYRPRDRLLTFRPQSKSRDPLVSQFESAITTWYAEALFALGQLGDALTVSQTAASVCRVNNDTNGVCICNYICYSFLPQLLWLIMLSFR